MGEVILNLLPVLIGALTVPIYPIIALIFLQSEGGTRKAIALMAGGLSIRVLQGLLFNVIFTEVNEDYPGGDDLIVSTLLLVLGIFLLHTAIKKWNKEEDPDAPPPQWMSNLDNTTILKAAGMGALYVLISPKQWLFTQIAIGMISDSELSFLSNVLIYLFYIIATQVFVLVPTIMMLISPEQAIKPIKALHAWLTRHSTTILIAMSLLLGLYCVYRGITGLLG